MPGARRVRKGQTGKRPSAEINRGGGRDGNGVDKFDGRANLQSGTKKPETREGLKSGKVIPTY